MKNITFKKQFIISILAVLGLSIFFTLLGIFIDLGLTYKHFILPANYYQGSIPDIERYINENNVKVLSKDYQNEFESIIPLNGIEYQVVDSDGELLYGHFDKLIVNTPVELKAVPGIEKNQSPTIIANIPVINNNKTEGMVILKYCLETSAKNPKFNWLVRVFEGFIFISPFVYIIIFTVIFSVRLNNRLKEPLNQLMQGAEKIKNKDLDFKIDYNSNDELGMLCKSFEEMRVELKKSLKQQWEMEQQRKEMVGAIAHDLKTPITIIKGHVEGLIDSKRLDEDKVYRYLGLIDKNADRMTRLIEKMNILTKIEKSNFNLQLEKCNIIKYINEKNLDYITLAENKKINFQYTINDERTEKKLIETDCHALSEILDNLISNSIRFTPKEGNIRFDFNISEENMTFSISDTGCGFSKKDLANIFEKFYQGDESRSKEKGHSGLGLYIVNILVDKFNGNIEVKNNEKGGAMVSVKMKLKNVL